MVEYRLGLVGSRVSQAARKEEATLGYMKGLDIAGGKGVTMGLLDRWIVQL